VSRHRAVATIAVIDRTACALIAAGSTVLACASPKPRLERIVLEPAATSLSAGGKQTFAAIARMSDGSSAPVGVSFSATGGTIAPDGSYSAGAETGTFRVVASLHDGRLSDTAEVLVTPASAHNYTTTFPLTENPISEGGRWINGGSVGRDWTDVSTTPGLAIGHQVGASYTDATAILAGAWGPDQSVTARVFATKQNDDCFQEVELRLRSTIEPSRNTGYEISFKSSQSSSAYLIIVRWNGALGNFTYLFNQLGSQFGLANGDIVGASIVGNVISAYKNGNPMAQVADDAFVAGAPGMGFNLVNKVAGCPGTNGDYGFASYTATDFAARRTDQ
jgi:hypothetical protein